MVSRPCVSVQFNQNPYYLSEFAHTFLPFDLLSHSVRAVGTSRLEWLIWMHPELSVAAVWLR